MLELLELLELLGLVELVELLELLEISRVSILNMDSHVGFLHMMLFLDLGYLNPGLYIVKIVMSPEETLRLWG